ncbi:YggS family pyridoxal phosphate-dependent enzyme [uncultured Umboniibacter sp.]|uniref:YggS family pyridoxal phosphate-dependent enzyme n=1 Tax=uncultured Umboniibacter sp. TaxID=1798917 RepID=UPI0026183313|nr:YggS family pyridoxal phosphate-dependent enzyme [uncultured Umboniibacter sp.]
MTMIATNIATVRHRVQLASQNSGRKDDAVLILAVSKTKPQSAIREAAACEQTHFGENYVQEFVEKVDALAALELCWHFIGPLQSNKTRPVAERADWVHTVDRKKIATRLNDQRPDHMLPLNVCIQVNIDNEASKAGVDKNELGSLVEHIMALEALTLRGLMAIPTAKASAKHTQDSFNRLSQLLKQLQQHFPDHAPQLDTLSMGMSADLELAINAGSTMVRVGTDIFGARDYPGDNA